MANQYRSTGIFCHTYQKPRIGMQQTHMQKKTRKYGNMEAMKTHLIGEEGFYLRTLVSRYKEANNDGFKIHNINHG